MTFGTIDRLAAGLGMCVCALLSQSCLSKVTILESPPGGPTPGAFTGAAGATPQAPFPTFPTGGAPSSFPNNPLQGPQPLPPNTPPPVSPPGCINNGLCEFVDARVIDKVDLLFVVDNTSVAADEQARLVQQLPPLVKQLVSGRRFDDDPVGFPAVADLHVGIVSTDMGTPGVGGLPGCDAGGGDDGRLQRAPHGATCDAAYPRFLSYATQAGTNLDKYAADLACVAQLGTQGCRFEQPLEAALKAVWPSVFFDSNGNVVQPNPIAFLPSTPEGSYGRGDVPEPQDGNLGFLRNDPASGQSLLAIVVLSHEDDCSARAADLFQPQDQLLPSSSFYNQDLNLRCFYNKGLLYDVVNRYAKAFRLLRQGNEDLVVFGAIAGVPPDLVDDVSRAGVDFTNAGQRNAYYAAVLGDSRMQEQLDPGGTQKLFASCSRTDAQGNITLAYPPRRMVELARAMGEDGVVQSICRDDFGMQPIVETIGRHLGADCLSAPLLVSAQGVVACDVIWELPPEGTAPNTTPVECAQAASFLKPVSAPRKSTNDRRGQNCIVSQLPVLETSAASFPPAGQGWYYDPSAAAVRACHSNAPQRIAFSAEARPPTGVNVVLDCKPAARIQ